MVGTSFHCDVIAASLGFPASLSMRDVNLGLSWILHHGVLTAKQAESILCEQPFGALSNGSLDVRPQSLQVGLSLSDHMVKAQQLDI